MPDLPPISEDFDADASGYLAAIQLMIDRTTDLIGKVTELKDLVDQLDGKTIAINVAGNANAMLDKIADKISALDGKTVVVNVIYRSSGIPDIDISPRTVREQIDENVNINPHDAGAQRGLADAIDIVNRKLAEENVTAAEAGLVLQRLAYAANAAGRANKEEAAAAEQAAAAAEIASKATFDQTAVTLASIDASLTGVMAARLLADEWKLNNQEADQGAGIFSILAARLAAVGAQAVFTGGAWGIFGGTFRGVLGNIGLVHLAFDALLEGMIALVDTAIVVAIALAGMAPAAQDIVNHLKAMHTAGEALGQQIPIYNAMGQAIPKLSGGFEKLQHQMAPGVVELYGAAINALASGPMGLMEKTAMTVENIFTTWAAKIDIWLKSNSNFGKILQDGVGYLRQFGQIIGEVFIAIDNLLKASPGTVHFLLDFFVAAGKVLDVITSLPTPILMVAIALHSMWLWGNVLLTWAVNMIAKIPSLVAGFAALAANPFTWVAVAAAGLAYLAFESTQASASAKDFINSVNSWVGGLSASQAAVGGIDTAIQSLNIRIANTDTGSVLQQWGHGFSGFANTAQMAGDDLRVSFSRVTAAMKDIGKGDFLGAAKQGFDDITNFLFHSDSAAAQASKNIAAYKGAIVQLTGEQSVLFRTASAVMNQNKVGFTQALGLMDAAGVQAGDNFQVAFQKVENLITGYRNLGIQAGLLGQAENAVTFQTEQQNSKISAVTGAFTNFINTLTGGVNALNTWSVQLQAVYDAAGKAATSLSVANGRATLSITGLGQAANDARPYVGGLGANSIALSQAFSQQITNGTGVINNLLTLASAAGEGAKGTALVTQAGKDMVAELLPMAQNSKVATALLYGLAQTAGYQGVDSFKALAQWVGNNVDPAKSLNSIVNTLTVSAANLTQDVKNLAAAINTNLNSAMAAAIIQANGGQKAFDNAATAVNNAHGQMQNLIPTAQQLANTIYNDLGRNVNQAHAEFDTFYEAMGLTKGQADTLWSEIVGKLTPALNNIPKNIHTNISASASGSGGIGTHISGLPSGVVNPFLKFITLASGGKIPGYGGGDTVAAMLEPGETIVPKHLTSTVAPLMKAHGVPGFAAGGIAGGFTAPSLPESWMASTSDQFVSNAERLILGKIAQVFQGDVSKAQSGISSPISGAAKNLIPYFMQAIALTGVPGSWLFPLEEIALHESGFNVNAINLWDSNAAAGDPSRGLMQVIMSTFLANHQPGTSFNIYDPVANIAAAIRYIERVYGNVFNVPGVKSLAAGGPYVGYDSGGFLMPGLTMAYNGTGQPERVTPPGGEVGLIHNVLQVDGKVLFESTKPYVYQYNSRNNGNGNITGSWRPS